MLKILNTILTSITNNIWFIGFGFIVLLIIAFDKSRRDYWFWVLFILVCLDQVNSFLKAITEIIKKGL